MVLIFSPSQWVQSHPDLGHPVTRAASRDANGRFRSIDGTFCHAPRVPEIRTGCSFCSLQQKQLSLLSRWNCSASIEVIKQLLCTA